MKTTFWKRNEQPIPPVAVAGAQVEALCAGVYTPATVTRVDATYQTAKGWTWQYHLRLDRSGVSVVLRGGAIR